MGGEREMFFSSRDKSATSKLTWQSNNSSVTRNNDYIPPKNETEKSGETSLWLVPTSEKYINNWIFSHWISDKINLCYWTRVSNSPTWKLHLLFLQICFVSFLIFSLTLFLPLFLWIFSYAKARYPTEGIKNALFGWEARSRYSAREAKSVRKLRRKPEKS